MSAPSEVRGSQLKPGDTGIEQTGLILDSEGVAFKERCGKEIFSQCSAGIELSDGTVFKIDFAKAELKESEDGIILHYPGTDLHPEMDWHIKKVKDQDAQAVFLSVKNTTLKPLSIEKLMLISTPNGMNNASFTDTKASQMGWETACPAFGKRPLTEHEYMEECNSMPATRLGNIKRPYDKDSVVLPWMTQLEAGEKNALLGFSSAKKMGGFIQVWNKGEKSYIEAYNCMEGITLDTDESVQSEQLLAVFSQDSEEALQIYAKAVAENMKAKPAKKPTSRWCSWDELQWDINEEIIRKNAEVLAAKLDDWDVRTMVIDDYNKPGSSDHIGDWLKDSEKFPSGFESLNGYIHSLGLKSIFWLSPLIAQEQSELYTNHKDWFVKDRSGNPLIVKKQWGDNIYALDTTRQDVLTYLEGLGRKIREMGFDGTKEDFNFLSCARGIRSDTSVTGLEAMIHGLEALHRGLGEDADIYGVATPYISAVGLYDNMRNSMDAARDYNGAENEPSVKQSRRAWAMHEYMKALYQNDLDSVMLRRNRSNLTIEEIYAIMVEVCMHNTDTGIGDDLDKLDKPAMERYSFILPPSKLPGSSKYLAYDEDNLPTRQVMGIKRPWDTWTIAAVYNTKDETDIIPFNLEDFGLDPEKNYHIFDQLNQEYLGSANRAHQLLTPAHGVRALAIREAKEYPQIIGSGMHLLCGAVEITSVEQSENGSLSLSLRGGKEGTLTVFIPEGYCYEGSAENIIPGDNENILVVKADRNMRFLHLPFSKAQIQRADHMIYPEQSAVR